MQTMKISELAQLPVFPFADEFPFLSEEEEMELAQDLELAGQQHPIILFQSDTGLQLLDGRNRLKAFKKTRVLEAKVEFFEGTEFQAVEKVRALNILRRHLTVGQRNMAALAYLPYEEAEAKRRQEATRLAGKNEQGEPVFGGGESPTSETKGKARDIVAEKFNTTGRGIQDAKKISINAPDLAELVKSGDMALDRATKELKARQEVMEKKIKAVENGAIDLYEKYLNRSLSLDDAYVALMNRQKEDAKKKAAKYNRAIELATTFADLSEMRLREFNLSIQDLNTVEQVVQVIGHMESVSRKIQETIEALDKWNSHLIAKKNEEQ